MTETETEIMKALECCIHTTEECDNCPYFENTEHIICTDSLIEDSLALINRKNAEIDRLTEIEEAHHKQNGELRKEVERLTKENHHFADIGKFYSEIRAEARAEAIKEVAERVKDEMKPTLFALFVIGEILVDVSKSHISSEKAFDDMREVLSRKGVIPSRFRFEKFLDQIAKEMGVEL